MWSTWRSLKLIEAPMLDRHYLKGDGYWAERLSAAGVESSRSGLRAMEQFGSSSLSAVASRLCADLIDAHLPPAELYTSAALLPSGSAAAGDHQAQ